MVESVVMVVVNCYLSLWWFLEGCTSIFMLEYWLNHLVATSIFRHLMAFGGLGEQDIGGRDVEAWWVGLPP